MVNKERVQKLVDALRSGEFEQGKEALRKGNCYCCLGVACEVYRKATKKGKWEKDDSFLGNDEHLPYEVAKYYGFDDTDPSLGDNQASEWNDSYDKNFKEIANLFEEYYLKGEAE